MLKLDIPILILVTMLITTSLAALGIAIYQGYINTNGYIDILNINITINW